MTVRKVSISLPQDVYQAIVDAHPNLPLSQAITDLIKNSLGISVRETFGMTAGKTTIPPELVDLIRAVVREEITSWQQDQIPPDEHPTHLKVKEEEETKVTDEIDMFGFNPEHWYTQAEVREKLPASINPNTKKSKISKAVATGRLVSNGKKGLESRIEGKSAIDWLMIVHQDYPSHQQQG